MTTTNTFSLWTSAIVELARMPAERAGFSGGLIFSGCRLEALFLIEGELHSIWGGGGSVIDSWELLEGLLDGATGWTHATPKED